MNREKTASRVIATTLALMVVLAAFTPFVIGLAAADGHNDGEKGGTIVSGGGNSDAAEKNPSQFNEEGPTLDSSYETNQMPPVNEDYADAAKGDVSNFASLQQNGNGASTFSPSNGKTSVGVGVYNIPDNDVYTLGLDYDIPEGTTVKITPVRPTGEPIDNTYVLDGGDSVSNIQLSKEESNYIRETGELYFVVTACGSSSQFTMDEVSLVASPNDKSDTGYTEKNAISQEKLACGYNTGGGNSAPNSPSITIREFGDTDGTIEVGEQVRFTAQGTDPDGDSLTYTWTGAVSTQEGNPILKDGFSSAGEYTITVHASDGETTTTTTKTFTVQPKSDGTSNTDDTTDNTGDTSTDDSTYECDNGEIVDDKSDCDTKDPEPEPGPTPEKNCNSTETGLSAGSKACDDNNTVKGANFNVKVVRGDANKEIRQYQSESAPNQYTYAVSFKDRDGIESGGETVTVEWTIEDKNGNLLYTATKTVQMDSETGRSTYQVTYAGSSVGGQQGTAESDLLTKKTLDVSVEVQSSETPPATDDATDGADAHSSVKANYKLFTTNCPTVSTTSSEVTVGEQVTISVTCEPTQEVSDIMSGWDETIYESNADGGSKDVAVIPLDLGNGETKTIRIQKRTGGDIVSTSYSEPGTYTVEATATHEAGFKNSEAAVIVVLPKCENGDEKCKEKRKDLKKTADDLKKNDKGGNATIAAGLSDSTSTTYQEAGTEKTVNVADSAATTVATTVRSTGQSVGETFYNAGQAVGDEIKETANQVESAVDAGKEFIAENTGLGDGKGPVDQTLETGSEMANDISQGAKETLNNAQSTAQSGYEYAKDKWEDFEQSAKEKWDTVNDKINDVLGGNDDNNDKQNTQNTNAGDSDNGGVVDAALDLISDDSSSSSSDSSGDTTNSGSDSSSSSSSSGDERAANGGAVNSGTGETATGDGHANGGGSGSTRSGGDGTVNSGTGETYNGNDDSSSSGSSGGNNSSDDDDSSSSGGNSGGGSVGGSGTGVGLTRY